MSRAATNDAGRSGGMAPPDSTRNDAAANLGAARNSDALSTLDKFRLALGASSTAMLMVSKSGEIEFANAECEQLFGYPDGELIGKSIESLIPEPLRARRLGSRQGYDANLAGRWMGAGRELFAQRGDGTKFPVEIGLSAAPGALGPSVLAVVIDVSARRKAEQVLQDKLAELERANAGLAHFAFMASHDIQEPLRKIVSLAEILSTAINENNRDEIAYAGGVMRASAIRARELVADMLAYARALNGSYDFSSISVAEAVEAALSHLSLRIAEAGARIHNEVAALQVMGDHAQAVRLIQNLVENALKYHKPGAPPTVRISSAANDEGAPCLIIRDEGIGFPAQHREEIFEPFKRLHARGAKGGSGLGLAICKAIADRHGWRLTAQSAPGEGASFEVAFASVPAL